MVRKIPKTFDMRDCLHIFIAPKCGRKNVGSRGRHVPQYPIAGYANGQRYGYYNYVMVRVRSGQLFAMVTFRGRCPGQMSRGECHTLYGGGDVRFGCRLNKCNLDIHGDQSSAAPANFNLFDHHSASKYFRMQDRHAGRPQDESVLLKPS